MERNREARRGSMAVTNGLSRRRQRNGSLRDSPEEDGQMEFQETERSRDRGSKKDRDRLSRNKKRRGDRLMHMSNREEGGEESTEESVDDEEDDDDEVGVMVRMLPPNPASSSMSNHHHRRSFPPVKVVKTAPAWKVSDEMIGVSVPRRARSASVKRSHECWISGGGGGGEQIHRQASTSPARPNVAAQSPAPISPSSSNVSVRKKMKSIGAKHRPPRISRPSSSNQEEIEIEVAEVLYGLMRQSPCPSKQEIIVNASRVSSPISISHSAAPQPLILPQNSNSSTAPLPAVAPKRKRPRPVKYEEENRSNFAVRNSSVSSETKFECEQSAKIGISSPNLEKTTGSAVENGGASFDLGSSQAAPVYSEPQPELVNPESNTVSDPKPFVEEESVSRDGFLTKEEAPSPKKESSCARLDADLEDAKATKATSTASDVDSKREEKFKIDLMAPPPLRSSPERDGVINFLSDPKSLTPDAEMMQTVKKEDENVEKISKDSGEVGLEENKMEAMVKDAELQKPIVNKEKILDLEKQDRDSGPASVSGSKRQQQKQHPKATRNDAKADKTAQSVSLPNPMTVAGWPGGLLPLGYMPPLQTVVSMDGSTVSSAAVQQPPQSQPRPKRCATHYYIARNIHHHYQQFTRMNPFWPGAAGSASLYGSKPYNHSVPLTETTINGNPLQGVFPGRSSNFVQEKGQALVNFSGSTVKDKSSAAAKQAPQPEAASNLLLQQGPSFIFPVSQQQAAEGAAAAANQSVAVKSAGHIGNAASSGAANSASGALVSSSAMAAAVTSVSFNYPNLPPNEAQYLAMLQNNGYPFPIPAHVGVTPAYRGGTHAQAIPFFNGSFYSPQLLHPSQLQQQQPPHSQPQQTQQGHQNTSTSSGSSSSQKHQQTQQQRLQGSGSNRGGGSSHGFPASKNRPPQPPQPHQNHNVVPPHQAYQLEAEMGGEDSPSTADSRVSHAHKSIYGPSLIPIHPQNFAFITPAALGGGGSGNHGEKQQQQPQQQGLKGGVELIPSQAFAMSFASFNAAAMAPGIDFSSMTQNPGIFQSFPDAARHGYQIATAAASAQAAQQKKNHQITEEKKTGGDPINAGDERKVMAANAPANVGRTLAFSGADSTDKSGSSIPGHAVIDNSTRTLNPISAPVTGNRASHSIISTSTITTVKTPISQKHQQQLQQQQLQQQQLTAAAVARSKTSTASNASVYSDRLPSPSSLAAKIPNSLSVYPQALIQSSSPTRSPQRKNSPSLASTTTSPLKNLPPQQGGTHQGGRTEISFGVNSRSVTTPQGQQLSSNNHSASPPMVVVSPTNSSISKNAATGSKAGQAHTLSSQQAKNSSSGPSRKSSPVGGTSINGNSYVTTAPSSGIKPQLQQQHQLHKQALQQAQLFFSNACMQAQPPQTTSGTTTTSSNSATTANYHQKRQSEKPQQQQGGSAKAVGGGAAKNMKGIVHVAGNPHQLMSATFPYIHAVPSAVQVKPAEQKQPTA